MDAAQHVVMHAPSLRRLELLSLVVVTAALSVVACSGAGEGPPATQDPSDDLYDPPAPEGDAGPDDDLGALLEGGAPIFPADDAATSDAGDAGGDAASKP